jgi:elongation factor Ts
LQKFFTTLKLINSPSKAFLISKFYSEICLEEQPFVRDTDKTVADFVKETASKFGENVQIRRFVRMQLGEE